MSTISIEIRRKKDHLIDPFAAYALALTFVSPTEWLTKHYKVV